MKSTSLVVLAAVTGGLVLTAMLVSGGRSGAGGKATSAALAKNEALYPGLVDKLNKVSRVVIERGPARVAIVRDAGGTNWAVETKGGYPADFDLVRPIVAGVAQATIEEAKTAKPELHSRLEVENPSTPEAKGFRITLQDEEGQNLANVVVGKQDVGGTTADPFNPPPSDGKSRRFVRREGEVQTYLALMEVTPTTDALTFVQRSAADIKAERIRAVTIEHPAAEGTPAETLHIARTSSADAFTLRDQPAGRALKDEGAAVRLAQSLAFVNFDDVKPIAEVNFDVPGAVNGTFEYFDGITVRYTVVTEQDTNWVRFSATYVEPPAENTATATPATSETPTTPATPAGQATAEQPAANATAEVTPPSATGGPTPTPASPASSDLTSADQEAVRGSNRREAQTLNNTWSKWAYALPSFKVSQLRMKMEELLAPPAADAIPDTGMPSPGPLGPG